MLLAFRRRVEVQKYARIFCEEKKMDKVESCMQLWRLYVIKKQQNSQKVKKLEQKRSNKYMQTVFKILVCPEFYMSKEPRNLEVYE